MNISVVRATAMNPIMAAMEKLNVPISPLLEEANLPQPHCYGSSDWISSQCLLSLSDRIQQIAGISSFAHLAASAGSIEGMGEFGAILLQSETLNEALHKYCDKHVYYRSSANFFLMPGQNCLWFCRQTNGHFNTCHEQLEIYTLEEMQKVVRLAMGPDWWPGRLYFQSDQAPSFQDAAEEAGTELRFGQSFGGFAVPLSMLTLPLRYVDKAVEPEFFTEAVDDHWKPASSDFVGSLRQILPCYMRDGEIRIETVAEILGLSVRTLQRQLTQHGYCYRDLLEQVRFRIALNMLKHREFKLIDIAIDLGYGHAASFTRAFHRWAGVTPKKFREQMMSDARVA